MADGLNSETNGEINYGYAAAAIADAALVLNAVNSVLEVKLRDGVHAVNMIPGIDRLLAGAAIAAESLSQNLQQANVPIAK